MDDVEAEIAKLLLSYPDCPSCHRKCGWDAPGGWIACGACKGVGSTAEQMAKAEADLKAKCDALRARGRIATA